ncbi:hypothetical protein SteCoe_33435 [Stentor coeruleus]|uniref:Uncharacterized protein n=1 Tax=Stentor coeruleus TaxID=5963 RepID=A0A1R2AX54_9CILI|nr:hypothetical protein SteCoe_33435 [Stentor coeruleus]
MEVIESKAQKLIETSIKALKSVFREIKSYSEYFLNAQITISYVHDSDQSIFTKQLKDLQQKQEDLIERYKKKVKNISENKLMLKSATNRMELLLENLKIKENDLQSLSKDFKYEIIFNADYRKGAS